MLNNFNKQDKRLLSAAVILLLIFTYLLVDDSLLMDLLVGHGRKVANVIKSDNDVRQKYAADFRWISVKTANVFENDSIFTGSGSEATITLEDKTEIHLKENTLITFRTLNGQIVLGLAYGQAPEIKGDTNAVKIELPPENVLHRKPANQTDSKKPTSLAPISNVVSIPVITSPETYSKKQIQLNLRGEREGDGKVNMTWKYEKDNTKFEVEFSKTPDFTTVEEKLTTNEKQLVSPDFKEGTYYTRVREVVSENSFGKWSRPVQFDITHLIPESLPTPELVTKEVNSKFEDKKSPTIEWKPVEGATDYIVEISDDVNFKQVQQFKSGQTTFVMKQKTPGFYKFHVIAHNNLGIQSLPSEKGDLSIKTNAPVLAQVQPKHYIAKDKNDRPAPTNFNLKWSEVPSSGSYLIEIADNTNFQNPKQYQARSPASIAEIPTTGKYVWRVRSLASTGKPISDFSKPSDLLYTFESPLVAPKLKEPLDNMTLFFQQKNQNPFYLEWAKVEHASHYLLEISKDPEFKQVILKKSIANSRYLLTEKIPAGTLYWRVRSEAPQRLSEWSEGRKLSLFGGRTARGQ